MQINPIPPSQSSSVSRSDQPKKAADSTEQTGTGNSSPEQFKVELQHLSHELQHLLQQLNQHPEVREDRVQEVIERIQSGYYLTEEAALETAQKILENP